MDSTMLDDTRNQFQAVVRRAQEAVATLPRDNGSSLDLANNEKPQPPSIIPLDDMTLSSLSADAFPSPLGPMILAVAQATETPMELAAMIGLGTVAACCQKMFEVSPEPGYREPLSIWTAVALESGNRKTSVHIKMTEPLLLKERLLCEQSKTERVRVESERATSEARVKSLRARAANSEDSEEIERLTGEIGRLESTMPEVPTVPRLWTQDVTPEKLGVLMADNGERLALLSDEGGIFDILAGRYSNGIPNLDLFLQAHAGAPVRVDRGARPPVMMQHPALTMALSPQPAVLRGLSDQSRFRDRGLLARILYALPSSQLGYRTLTTQPVSEKVSDAYHRTVNGLLDFQPPRNEHGEVMAYPIQFSDAAYREWKDFQRSVEVNMRPGERFEHMKDWAGKLPGAVARVAGLFHCITYAHRQPWTEPLHLDVINQALSVLAVLSDHARAAFDLMGADPALEGARKVWHWIERGHRKQFTGRDCYQDLRGTFHKMNSLTPAFDVLLDRGYLIPVDNPQSGPGRKSLTFTVNSILTERWT